MPTYTKDFGDYSVKNVKSFMGMDTLGFNANLYRGKKKVAFCIDEGHGGEVNIDWLVGKTPKSKDQYPNEEAYEEAWKEWHKLKDEEEELLDAHIKKLPPVKSNFSGEASITLTIDAGWFITDLVSKWEEEREEKKMQRACKTKTLYRLKSSPEGEYWTRKCPFDERVREQLKAKYGEDLAEIINDRYK